MLFGFIEQFIWRAGWVAALSTGILLAKDTPIFVLLSYEKINLSGFYSPSSGSSHAKPESNNSFLVGNN